MWQEWVNLVAVTGGMELETSSCPGVASFLRGQQEESDGPRYLHNYAHFRAISRTLNTLKKENWDIDAATQELASAVALWLVTCGIGTGAHDFHKLLENNTPRILQRVTALCVCV